MIGARAYKKNVNGMCNAFIKVSADDILSRYKELKEEQNSVKYDIFEDVEVKNPEFEITNYEVEEEVKNNNDKTELTEVSPISENVIAKKTADTDKLTTKIKRLKPVFAIAACVIAATSLTIAAAENRDKISEVLVGAFGDFTTAKLVSEGYLYEINETKTGNGCSVTFTGVSGDYNYPVMMCDVRFDGKNFDKFEDEIEVEAYILGKEQYLNEKDTYATRTGYGVQDESTPGLYHVRFDAPRTWLINENTVIFDIIEVTYTEVMKRKISPDVQFEFAVPMEYLHKTETVYYGNVSVNYNDEDYLLKTIDYSVYDTMITFNYDMTYDAASAGMSQKKYEEKLRKNAEKILKDSYISVGKEKYECQSIVFGISYDNPGNGFVMAKYDALEDRTSKEIFLHICDTDLQLEQKKKMLSIDDYEAKKLEMCQEMAEKGYTYECNTSVENDEYKVTLVRVFGENDNPYLQFDVELKDPNEALLYDEIGITFRTTPALEYDQKENYGTDMFIGTKDEENPTIYHLYGRGAPASVGNDRKGVIDIFSIITNVNAISPTYNDVELNPIYVHTPSMSLKNAAGVNVSNNYIDIDNVNYTFTILKDAKMSTQCMLTFYIPEEARYYDYFRKDAYCQELAWNFVNSISLYADEKEYLLLPVNNEYLSNGGLDDNQYTVFLEYEPIDYFTREYVHIEVDDVYYNLNKNM